MCGGTFAKSRVMVFAAEKFVLLLAPFAPHIGEELWEKLGNTGTVAYVEWPKWDETKLVEAEIASFSYVNKF